MRRFLLVLTVLVLLAAGVFIVLVLTLDEDRAKRLIYAQIEARTGQELAVAGELNWRFIPWVSIEASDVRLSNPPDFGGPNMLEAGRLRASVRLWPLLRGELRVGDVTVEDAVLRLMTDERGRSNLEPLLNGEPISPDTPPSELTTGRIRLRNVTLDISDDTRHSHDRYRIDDFQLAPFAFGRPTDFEFRGGLGEPPVLENLRAAGVMVVSSAKRPIRISSLEVSGTLSGTDLDMGLEGEMEVVPAPLFLRLSGGLLEISGQHFRVSFEYRDAVPPHARAEISGKLLDLDRILDTMPGSARTRAEETEDHALAFLRDMDLDAALDLERLIVSGLEVRDVDATARSRGGVLVIEPLTGALAGGRLDARANIDLRPARPEVRIEPRFELNDIGEALAPWGLKDRLTGGGTLSLSLTTRSFDPVVMLEQLSGSGNYELSDGIFHGLDFGALLGAVQERDLLRAANEATGGQTPFQFLAGELRINEGRISLPDIRMQADEFGVDGQLELSLPTLELDGRLRMNQPRLERLPLSLGGTIDSPRVGIVVQELIREEGGRRARDWLRRRVEAEKNTEPET